MLVLSMFKPMLASDANLSLLQLPVLASPKLDGVRAIVRDGVVYSRSNKPIPNKFVQNLYAAKQHYDGELIFGDPRSKTCYRDTVSGVMSVDGEPPITFYVFDSISDLRAPYEERYAAIEEDLPHGIVKLRQQLISTLDELYAYETECLSLGYEGLILRSPIAPYKCGRSTAREGYLLKLKRFVDAEATVIGFEERMHNDNKAVINELGRTRRSNHKANKSGRGDLGALVCELDGVQFNIGTGFTDSERVQIWAAKDQYLGRLAKFKYFPVGIKKAPRHPIFLGWRSTLDL